MRILAFDLAKQLGWASFSDESGFHMVRSGSVDLAPDTMKRFESHSMRFVRLQRWLRLFKIGNPNTLIAYEAVRAHRRKGQRGHNVFAAQDFGSYKTTLMNWAAGKGLAVAAYDVGDIKRRATGKGNASKEAMIESANAIFGRKVEDDNEADALWIMMLVLDDEGIKLKI